MPPAKCSVALHVTWNWNQTVQFSLKLKITYPATGDVELQKHIDFARKVLQETVTAAESAANKQIKLYEKKHNIRTYTSGDTVFVDIGKRTKVKKHVNKQPAVVVEAFSGGVYNMNFLAVRGR